MKRLAIATALAAAAGGCALGRPPNLVLITLDTVRADRLGSYGHGPARTPALDGLAARGVLFERAFCQSPLTLPSHISILTGTYPFFHGVRDIGHALLGPRATTLAEVLKQQAGYTSAAFISGYPLISKFGLDQGFDLYDQELTSGTARHFGQVVQVERPAAETSARARAWLRSNRARPFFLWIHYFDPHSEYSPPAPFDRELADPYDGEIAYVDREIGGLLHELDQQGLLASTVITAISDHGESFGEHGELEHGLTLYDQAIRIPWILSLPDGRWNGRRIETLVESVDLMPTLLELLGIAIPRQVQGRSLVALLAGGARPARAAVYSETFMPRLGFKYCQLESLRTERWKYVRAPRPELYDLAADPDENHNLYADAAGPGQALERELARLLTFSPPGAGQSVPQALDPESQSRLASLGYLASPSGWQEGDLNAPCQGDPKDLVPLVCGLQFAQRMIQLGRPDAARERLDQILRLDPGDAEHGQELHQMAQGLLQRLQRKGG